MHIFVTIINQILNWENENNWNAFKNENKRQESKPKSKKTFTNSTHVHNFTPIQHIPIYHAPKIIVLIYIGKVFNRINAYRSLL